MVINMSEIESIKTTLNQQGQMLSSLDKRAAVTDNILDSIQETQKGIAQILESQSAQRERNRHYDSIIEKSEAASIRRDDDIALINKNITENKISITSILARLVVIASILSTGAVMVAQYAIKALAG